MEEKQKVTNINFFKKLWYSITKFESYPAMSAEGVKRAIKYLIILTGIVSIFVMIGSLLQMKNLINELAKYIDENIPEFTYSAGNLNMQTEEQIVLDGSAEYGIDRIVIDTDIETAEQKEQVEKDDLINGITIFFLKDEIILKTQLEDGQILRQTYTYNDFLTNYTGEYIEKFDKTEFIQYLTSEKMSTFYVQYAISMFVYLFIINIILALLDSLEIAILGMITTTIARIKMKFVAIYNMAVYSLTLPMILNILYIVINYFTDFTITYFQVAYVTIAYIYLATAIFLLKDEFIRRMQEVEKIKQEQLKVREEIKEEQEKKEKEEKTDDQKEDKKENDKGDEPQGSEV